MDYQNITITGRIANDVTKAIDKNGQEYMRFLVSCIDKDVTGKQRVTLYRCYSYVGMGLKLKMNDYVFVAGEQKVIMTAKEVHVDIFVSHIHKITTL